MSASCDALARLAALDLPLAPRLAEVLGPLHDGKGLVLTAEPGAGKTSLVPLAVALEAGAMGLPAGRVLVLEPRRIAAVQAAWRGAELLGEKPGGKVGYRVRGDSRPGALVEFMTEGVFIRLVQEDPGLRGVCALVLDEFHERSLAADLGLALALEAREAFCPQLRIVLMSATIAAERLAAHIGAPVLEVAGRSFPIETRHVGPGFPRNLTDRGFEEALAGEALRLFGQMDGDLLIFLPGGREIGKMAQALEARSKGPGSPAILPLHGSLPLEAQRRVVAPGAQAGRRIILATSVAETSLTVPRIGAVLDAGLARLTRYDARTGLNRLVTEREAADRADQRRGRAGRLGPGLCLRAWDKAEVLVERTEPEILRAELSGLVLEAAVWGALRAEELEWLDAPPASAWVAARELLLELGAVDAQGKATAFGAACARMGAEPRLAALVLRGSEAGRLSDAAALAAILAERGSGEDADLGLALEALRSGRGEYARARDEAARLEVAALRERGSSPPASAGPHGKSRSVVAVDGGAEASYGSLLAPAFPDRVAKRIEARGAQASFQLPGGRKLKARGALAAAPWIVAAEADSGGVAGSIQGSRDSDEGTVFAGAALDEGEALSALASFLSETTELDWTGLVPHARSRRRAGAILLSERPLKLPPRESVASAFALLLKGTGLSILPWEEGDAAALLSRLRWYGRTALPESWPDLSDTGLLASAETWLLPFVGGGPGPVIDGQNLRSALDSLVPASLERAFRCDAPGRLELPSGRSAALDYGSAAPGPGGMELGPVLEARPADFYGLAVHPAIMGRPMLIRLLSPAGRPIHVTADLPGFWRGAWLEVRKDLRGRYPRHDWPEDPSKAKPSSSSIKKRSGT